MRFAIGLDCAAQDKNFGLALGEVAGRVVVVRDVVHSVPQVLPFLLEWMSRFRPVLLAFDAPLGWPAPMGRHLGRHLAGEPIVEEPDHLFSRYTDRVVRARTGKRPLEVGADRIARAALRAVRLLGEVRAETSLSLPLAVSPGMPEEPSAIEVYPAATLLSRGLASSGYKGRGREKEQIRAHLLESLGEQLRADADPGLLIGSDHAFDAALCLLSGLDFLMGEVVSPEDRTRAETEGWIWFRP